MLRFKKTSDADVMCKKIMNLERIGKKYRIPLDGSLLEKIHYEGRYSFYFTRTNNDKCQLDIDSEFIVKSGDNEISIKPLTKEPHHLITALEGYYITSATATKYGELEVKLENGMILRVEDGPYENWHYSDTKRQFVHGGVGRLIS